MNENERKIELTGEHYEAMNQALHDNGLTACAVYTKDGHTLGVSRMDPDAAAALISGMRSMPHVWNIEAERGNHLGSEFFATNLVSGVRVGVYR